MYYKSCAVVTLVNLDTPVWFSIILGSKLLLHNDLKSLLWLSQTSSLACASLKGPFHSAEFRKSNYHCQESMETLLLPPCWSHRSSLSWQPHLTPWHEWVLLHISSACLSWWLWQCSLQYCERQYEGEGTKLMIRSSKASWFDCSRCVRVLAEDSRTLKCIPAYIR